MECGISILNHGVSFGGERWEVGISWDDKKWIQSMTETINLHRGKLPTLRKLLILNSLVIVGKALLTVKVHGLVCSHVGWYIYSYPAKTELVFDIVSISKLNHNHMLAKCVPNLS